MFSNFYILYLENKTHVALANTRWNICKYKIENSNLPLFSYGYQNCMFVDFLTKMRRSS